MRTPRRLTRARLHELLHYDKDTGEFRWWERDGKEARLGNPAGCVRICVAWLYMKGRWGRPMIDHRDGDSTNNRWSNLRRATASQNGANSRRPRHNTSGYKGVVLCRRSGRWRASVRKNGRRIYLGTFATPEAAHDAYVAAARELFGDFARPE